MQTPIDLWLGKYGGAGVAGVLALQVFWALVLIGFGRIALRAGSRKLVVQGG
jgi:ABC-2 type transport system permease protein